MPWCAEIFQPHLQEALGRLEQVQPSAYAASRNHLQGAVSRLSPYITHGMLTLPQVRDAVMQRHALPPDHKFIQELGWREFFAHVWRHRGDGIFSSLHEGPLPDAAYARELPADIAQARTGLPVIDEAVRELYASGYLHNHARMWLASYIVHLRKVHWRVGADWLYGHLIDGDLASNHLSWQWVAGTGSHKPYLFNAENVARFAPSAWHSAGTVVDVSYEQLDELCRCMPVTPATQALPAQLGAHTLTGTPQPRLLHEPPFELRRATSADLAGAWIVHPWNLGEPPPRAAGLRRVGIFVRAFHQRWAWSERRWNFVRGRMQEMGLDMLECVEPLPQDVSTQDDLHLRPWLQGHVALEPVPRIWAEPDRACHSFSQFWRRVQPRAE